jgi:hypothetical protein
MQSRVHCSVRAACWIMALICFGSETANAHPFVENAIDVVVGPRRIDVEVRVALEEIVVVETDNGLVASPNQRKQIIAAHAEYVRKHVHLLADGEELVGRSIPSPAAADDGGSQDDSSLVPYRLEYPLARPPKTIRVEQDFLREFSGWSAPCVLRMRRADQPAFDTSLLKRGDHAELDSSAGWHWPAKSASAATTQEVPSDMPAWPAFRAYLLQGIEHILTGYDHLLFVAALVLAATSLWDLIKVVTAFTLAHTATLALSVFNIVHVGSAIVEPMISLSIVLVAVQNIFWPKQSRGWTRLAIAFSFGLFHGLGFAGGLKVAMSQLPSSAVWLALIAFSLGVEIGHQIVVLPTFAILTGARRIAQSRYPTAATRFDSLLVRCGSAAIAAAGCYFVAHAWLTYY